MNKTVVVELDQNGKEIFHTAGYEKYWISRVGMETVWLRKERVKEVVSVQETFAAMEFLEKPERGIVSAEISIRMKMTDESCRWTRVGYEIMMPDNGTDKKVVVTFTDEEKENTKPFENYSSLDDLGRCGVAFANICKELMPTEEREPIGQIKPSGWHPVKYNGIIIYELRKYLTI